jgi:hypothetical protein
MLNSDRILNLDELKPYILRQVAYIDLICLQVSYIKHLMNCSTKRQKDFIKLTLSFVHG